MAGSATITGKQNYVMGIGHPKTNPDDESAPVMAVTNPLTGGIEFNGASWNAAEMFGAKPSASASENSAAIQRALDAGGRVTLTTAGVYQINSTLVIGSNTEIYLGAGVVVRLAANSNRNMLRNSNWGSVSAPITSLSTANGITVTANTATPHGKAIGSQDWMFVYGAAQEVYNGVFYCTFTGASSYTYRIAIVAPSEPVTTPATGTIAAFPANGNICLSGPGVWDSNQSNQSTPDTFQTCSIYLRRVANLKIRESSFVYARKYAVHIVNFENVIVDSAHFDTESDCLHFGGSGKHVVCRSLSGRGGDDYFAVTQGDYPQYVDPGYIIGAFDDLNVDLDGFDGSLSAIKLVPIAGYTWGVTTINNVAGRFSGGSGLINLAFDAGCVQQDGVTPSLVGTLGVVNINGLDNQQTSSKPLIQVSCVLNTLRVNNLSAKLGFTAGTSTAILVTATGNLKNLQGTNWSITGGVAGILVNGLGTLGDVTVSNFRFDGTTGGVVLSATSLPNGAFHFSNGRANAMATFLTTAVRGVGSVPIPFFGSNLRYTSPSGAFFTGTSASAQLDATLSSCAIPTGAEIGGTWLNKIVDWSPLHRDSINYAASITPDLAVGSIKHVSAMTAAMTINAPTSAFASNGQAAKTLTFVLVTGAATAAMVSWNAAYVFPVAFTNNPATSGVRSVLTFAFDDNGKWICTSGANSWQ